MKKNLLLFLTFGIFSIMVAQIQCSYNELKNYRQSLDSNFLNKFKHQRIKDVKNALLMPQPSFKPYVNPPNAYSMMGVTTNSNAHYVIPIAIHVVHDGSSIGTGCNISDAQIINQINELNASVSVLQIGTRTKTTLMNGTILFIKPICVNIAE